MEEKKANFQFFGGGLAKFRYFLLLIFTLPIMEQKSLSSIPYNILPTFQNTPTKCGIFRNGDGGVYLSSVK